MDPTRTGRSSNALIGSAADYPQNGANPKPDVPSDATDADSTRTQRKSRLDLPRLALLDRPPSKLLAVRTGTRKSGQHPFADHGALKLGKDPKHLEHRLPNGVEVSIHTMFDNRLNVEHGKAGESNVEKTRQFGRARNGDC